MDYWLSEVAESLAKNLITLREKRGYSQVALSKISGVPRSTIAHMETGNGNPSLQNLSRVSSALQISVEELLSKPRAHCQLIKAKDLRAVKRNNGAAVIFKLLPDSIPGMEMDRMVIEKGGRLGGVPHMPGTKEYMVCESGKVCVFVQGEKFEVNEGDVFAFPGDLPHSYQSIGPAKAICFSVVVLANRGNVKAG